MFKLIKKLFFLFLIFIFLFFPKPENTEADISTELKKTVEFFAGQDNSIRASEEQFSFYFNNVNIPEAPTVKKAVVEIRGVSYNNSGNKIINVDMQQGSGASGIGTDYILGGENKPKSFVIKYDAWKNGTGPASNITAAGIYDYTLYLKGISGGGTGSFSISSAKLILTYDHSSSETSLIKTTKFFTKQETGNTADGLETTKDFSIVISEQSPVIRSVFIEIYGIAKGSGIGTASISVVDKGSAANYTNYSLDLGSLANTTPFKIIYDASTDILSSSFPGAFSYTIYLKGTGFDVYTWGAKTIVTYNYSEIESGLPVSGNVISSTIDTGIVKGAAFNALMWKGNLNGGKVRLQFAASDCPDGQSDYPSCAVGIWGDSNTPYIGPDCTPLTHYESLSNTPVKINCANIHNNKRYFRYKIILCSAANCITSGNSNPEVTDVVVNWSK